MRTLTVMTILAVLILPPVVFAETQTYTATHTYILGDHDSKDDARQRCLLEAKRKILERAGVYIESASEVNNFDLTKDKITSFAAAVMQVKDTKEDVGFQQGHMTLTLKLTAQVDLAEARKQLAARQADTSVRDDVAVQNERLKRLEFQFEAMQREMQRAPGRTPIPPTRDISTADVQWLRTQAAEGNAKAQAYLGVLYSKGHGVPQDYAMARQWWEKAAAQGNANAQYNLGIMYINGEGVQQDYTKARQWYVKAAAQDYSLAQYSLGVMYHRGDGGVPQDYAMARQWYEKAAGQGNADAQISLGNQYAVGNGVPKDYTQAAKWYEKAAAQGNANAQFLLGGMYFKGEGVPQDYGKARQWYEKTAAQGDAWALIPLGVMYLEGWGVPQDYVRSYMWVNLAAASMGSQQKLAVESRDRLASIMTPEQIAEGQRLSQQCQTRQFKGC